MATYEFECNSCKSIMVLSCTADDLKYVQCLECGSKTLTQIGFDRDNSEGLYLLAKEFGAFKADTEKRLEKLEYLNATDDNE